MQMLGSLPIRIHLAALLAVGSLGVAASDLPLKKSESYVQARAHLVRAGWRPVVVQTILSDGRSEREWGAAKQMQDAGFDEIESCSGTGLNYCFFNFRRKDYCLRVVTAGEYHKEYDSPKVHSWSVRPCAEIAQ